MYGRFSSNILDRKQFEKREIFQQHLSPKELKFIKDSFQNNDTKGTNELNIEELKQVLEQYGIDINNDEFKELFDEVEKNGEVGIDFDEFIEMITEKLVDIDSMNDVQKYFTLFLGEDNVDKIEQRHLKKLCPGLTNKEIEEMIQKADEDKDGKINFEEFYNITTKKI